MSEAEQVYDFYKDSIFLYLSVSFTALAPLWPGWSMRLIWAGLGVVAITLCWMRQSRKALYFDNDYHKRQEVTANYKLPQKQRKFLLGAILMIAFTVSAIGVFKFGFGEYQFIGLSVSIFMLAMAISNLVYLPVIRRKMTSD